MAGRCRRLEAARCRLLAAVTALEAAQGWRWPGAGSPRLPRRPEGRLARSRRPSGLRRVINDARGRGGAHKALKRLPPPPRRIDQTAVADERGTCHLECMARYAFTHHSRFIHDTCRFISSLVPTSSFT